MRYAVLNLGLAAVLLAACAPSVPNSAAQGAAFTNPETYQAQRAAREAELSGTAVPTGMAISDEAVGSTPRVPQSAITTNNPGISDEQNFAAVSGRETIESDAERLERQRAAYQVIAPEPLPTRSGASGPNIVAFALNTTNGVGEAIYRRSGGSAERAERACGRFASPGLAQEEFLASGGPENDRKGLDPDGDGFACDWDPTPFRAVARR